VIKEIVELVDHRDQPTRVRCRRSDDWPTAILNEAAAADASLIVLGVAMRPSEALLFARPRIISWRRVWDRACSSQAKRTGETTLPHPQGLRSQLLLAFH
jgi:hypothetical protein